jgi:hydrogenase nickel incorporation protein HypA/HybF
MHEYSLVQALLEQVDRQARAHHALAIYKLHVSVGELAGVEVALLKTAYATFRERTRCAGAELEVRSVPARWSCPGCGRVVPRGEPLRCVDCGTPARLGAGGEIVLDRIEMEVS